MIVLDTCSLLWLASDQTKLSDLAREQISENRDGLFVSAISAFEIGIKHGKGKLELTTSRLKSILAMSWPPRQPAESGLGERAYQDS